MSDDEQRPDAGAERPDAAPSPWWAADPWSAPAEPTAPLPEGPPQQPAPPAAAPAPSGADHAAAGPAAAHRPPRDPFAPPSSGRTAPDAGGGGATPGSPGARWDELSYGAATSAAYPPPTPPPYAQPYAQPNAQPNAQPLYGGSAWGTAPALDTQGRPLDERPRRRVGGLVAGGIAVALLAGAVGGAAGSLIEYRRTTGPQIDGSASLGVPAPGTTSRPPDSVAGVAARVLPSVVQIEVRSATAGGTGTGFVLRSDGYILTNNHVVADAVDGKGTIKVTFNDGRSTTATIVGRDTTYDLAVVKIPARNLPTLVLGDSNAVVVGDPVVAVGSPLGLAGTVTSGIISAKDRPVTTGSVASGTDSYLSALQTDAAINPGNSGGPLVDMQGRVIGVNSAIATLGQAGGTDPNAAGQQSGSIGLGFAIPIDQARRVAEQLIRTGKASHPVIGAYLDPAYTGDGVRLASTGPGGKPALTPGGPAAQAGLQPGDVILRLDGKTIDGDVDFLVALRARAPGDTVTLVVRRNGANRTLSVRLGSSS